MRIGIVGRLFIAMAVGAAVGVFSPDWVIRTLNSFGSTFGQFIKFFVPFIVIGLVTPAIAETGKGAGKLLLATMGIAYASTLFAGAFAFGIVDFTFPRILERGALGSAASVQNFPAYFTLEIPPLMGITTALATAFIFGLAIVASDSPYLRNTFNEIRSAVTHTIQKAFLPLLPFYILVVIADLTASGKLAVVGGGCVKIMVTALCVTTAVLLIQYAVAGLIARRNPFKALFNMLPAYLTGWGCCSSAATLPVTLRQTRKNGVSGKITDLVIPLCSNVHLAGSMANMVVYTAGFIVLGGGEILPGRYAEFMFMLSIIAVASPGIPGGVVLASAAIAETVLGFTPERYALVIATYMALDGMGTACNLTGDGAIAMIADRFFGRREPHVFGRIADSARYESLHPRFRAAFDFLRRADLAQLPCGRYEIDGDDCWASISESALKPFSDSNRYEVHRTFIDIQAPISGRETIGIMVTPPGAMSGFDAEKDYALFDSRGEAKVLGPGDFAIFFPEDGAHAPCCSQDGSTSVRKVVVKIRS